MILHGENSLLRSAALLSSGANLSHLSGLTRCECVSADNVDGRQPQIHACAGLQTNSHPALQNRQYAGHKVRSYDTCIQNMQWPVWINLSVIWVSEPCINVKHVTKYFRHKYLRVQINLTETIFWCHTDVRLPSPQTGGVCEWRAGPPGGDSRHTEVRRPAAGDHLRAQTGGHRWSDSAALQTQGQGAHHDSCSAHRVREQYNLGVVLHSICYISGWYCLKRAYIYLLYARNRIWVIRFYLDK